jgi:hypothetical protein
MGAKFGVVEPPSRFDVLLAEQAEVENKSKAVVSVQPESEHPLEGRMYQHIRDNGKVPGMRIMSDAAKEAAKSYQVWRDGEPMCFEDFVGTIDPQARLTKRQVQVFNDTGMNGAYSWVTPERKLNEIVLLWGKGSQVGDTLIKDELTSMTRSMRDWEASGQTLVIKSVVNGSVVDMQAGNVFCKGKANVWMVLTEDGRQSVVSADHQFKTERGWVKLRDLRPGIDGVLCTQPHDPAYARICPSEAGSLSDCHSSRRSCDVPVLLAEDNALEPSPSQGCVRISVPSANGSDGLSGILHKHTSHGFGDASLEPRNYADAYQPLVRVGDGESFLLEENIPETTRQAFDLYGSLLLEEKQSLLGSFAALEASRCEAEWQYHFRAFAQTVRCGIRRLAARSASRFVPQSTDVPQEPCQESFSAWDNLSFVRVVDIIPQTSELIYDVTVPVAHNYFDAQGILHHNSGKDWLAAKANAYIGYVMCNLNDEPAVYFREHCGLVVSADMVLAALNVAPAGDLAIETYFRYLLANLTHPIFEPYRPVIKTEEVLFITEHERARAKEQDNRKPLPFFALASKNSAASGLDGYNLVSWIMDEADAFVNSDKKNNAELIHKILRSSCNTRMRNLWTGFVISYPRVKEGFMLSLYERANKNMRKLGPNASYYADLAATWDVRPSVSRQDAGIVEDYENDPDEAAALYECIPMETVDAFIEMPEKIDASVDRNRYEIATVTQEDYQTTRSNGAIDYYIRASVSDLRPTPGHTYFLAGDAGGTSKTGKGDAYALSVWHMDNQADGYAWLCPRCVGIAPTLLSGANYERQAGSAREAIKAGQFITCGVCMETSAAYHGSWQSGSVSVAGWYKKVDKDKEASLVDAAGNAYNVGHLYEDLLIQVKPVRKGLTNNHNRSVFFPAIRAIVSELIVGLPVQASRFDPWQTAEMTMALREDPGGDVEEISFSQPEQFKRAKLAKAMLYAGLLHFLPNERRDREWKRLQRINGTKIDHPDGPNEGKDMYDVEAVCIFMAVTHTVGSIELMNMG